MPSFSRHDIENMSFRAAEQFSEGTPLHDSVVKLARDNQMNPEQIRRLVEASNTTTFLNEFKTKTGNQRMVEFDVANPDKVIDEALSSDSGEGKAPGISITISIDPNAGLHDSISDENSPLPELEPSSDKVASYLGSFFSPQEEDLSLSSYQKYQAKESLLTKIADCNYRAEDIADEIACSYRGIYTLEKHASFELDAYSLHGNKAAPALQMVRNRLRMPKIARDLTPQESFILSDRHVVESQNKNNLDKLATMLDIVVDHKKYYSGLKHLENLGG